MTLRARPLASRRALLFAFKPGIDDVRDSPSLPIVKLLLERDVRLAVHDPLAADSFRRVLGPRAAGAEFVVD